MANIDLVTSGRVEVVESLEQMTLAAAEAITAGAPVRLDTTTGKFTNANGTTLAEARVYGIATRTVVAGEALTALRHGVMDGFDVSGLDYDAGVYLSDTDGRVNNASGTIPIVLGRVVPGTATTLGTAYDKLVHVDVRGVADGVDSGGISPQEIEVVFHAQAAADMVDQTFFVATQAYQVTKVAFVHAVAESTAATLLAQVTKDTSTNAPGAGTDLLTNNTNTGFNCKATANTVQNGTLTATTADLQLAAGNRLSVDFSAAATELVGVTITVSLKRI